MSNKVYMLQVSDGEDPKLSSKIIIIGEQLTCQLLCLYFILHLKH